MCWHPSCSAPDGMKAISRAGVVTIIIAVVVLLLGGTCVATYNKLVRLDQAATAQWAQVENAYQRRADLVPNLVETVKGAAAFERGTITEVTEARSRVGQLAVPKDITTKPEQFQQYQQAQDQLGGALSRLLVVAEAYPNLKATENFRDLQAQLEGTERGVRGQLGLARGRFADRARVHARRRNGRSRRRGRPARARAGRSVPEATPLPRDRPGNV